MAITSPDQASSYKFRVIERHDLRLDIKSKMDELTYESLLLDYDRSPQELSYAVHQISRTRLAPNKALAGPLWERRQSFSQPKSVLAYKNEKLVGILATGNNASSQRHPLLGGLLEQQAKLHIPRMISRNYRWIGLRVRSPEEEPGQAEDYDPEKMYMIDIMGYIAVGLGHPQQPVSAYPYKDPHHNGQEKLWPETLASWGLEHSESRPDENAWPFGEHHDPVTQEAWGGVTVDTVKQKILSKTASTEILQAAGVAI